MAASGFTPISLYYSATASAVPLAANLVAGELSLNTNDGKLYYKNSSNVVTLLAGATSGPAGGSNTQVQFNSSGVLAGSANMTFNGTILTAAGFSGPLNGTVGATTPATGAFTTLSATGVATFSAGTAALPAITTTGDTNTGIFFPAADTIAFSEGGAEAMRIDSSGNVGIGTSSPNTKLTVGTPNTQTVALAGSFSGATPAIATGIGMVTVNSTDTVAVDKGGVLSFTANTTTLSGYTMAAIAGKYETAGAGVYSGYLQFITSNSAGTIAERMRIDSSGNVGIGTTSPSAPLQVNGTATAVRATSAQLWLSRTTAATQYQGICLRVGAASDAFIGRPPASDDIIFGFDTGALLSEKMRITDAGNVGIGTTTTVINDIVGAARPLVVAVSDAGTSVGGATASINIVNTNTTTSNSAQLNFASTYTSSGINTVSAYISTIFGARTNTANYYAAGTLVFGTNNGGVANGPTEQMRITSTGDVGIGTSSPTAKFVVAATGYTSPLIRSVSTSPTGAGVYGQFNAKYGGTDRDWFFGQASDGSFNIWDYTPGVTNRLTITTGGIVGIATTSPNSSFQATVAGSGFATTRVNFGGVAGYSDGSSIICGSDSVNPTSWVNNANFKFGSNRDGCVVAINPTGYTYEGGSGGGSRTFAVNSNGNVQNSNNSYGSLSDAKLKENIADATPKLESLMRVKIRNFNLIADEAKTKQIGVVAQELEEIFPSMIEEHIDRTFEPYVREDGVADSRGIPTGTVTKEVKYSVFVPMLIKAMQEQQALITSLTARIAALET
jgi:hypothetical protein